MFISIFLCLIVYVFLRYVCGASQSAGAAMRSDATVSSSSGSVLQSAFARAHSAASDGDDDSEWVVRSSSANALPPRAGFPSAPSSIASSSALASSASRFTGDENDDEDGVTAHSADHLWDDLSDAPSLNHPRNVERGYYRSRSSSDDESGGDAQTARLEADRIAARLAAARLQRG